jgi:hypothetical protein
MLTPESSAGRTIRMATAKATVILRHYVEGGCAQESIGGLPIDADSG